MFQGGQVDHFPERSGESTRIVFSEDAGMAIEVPFASAFALLVLDNT